MVFRPRGCYMCGQLGHYAEKCEFTERRCFNCLEAGHESSACEAPRTAETKQCYGCGGKGHIRADCTNADAKADKTCYRCGETGHISTACPSAPADSVQALKEAPPQTLPQDGDAPARTRPARKRKPKTKKCHSCNQPGHIAKECPNSQATMAEAPGSNAGAALTA